jgi:hypothetical protein
MRKTLVYCQVLGKVNEPIFEYTFEFLFVFIGVADHVGAPVFIDPTHLVAHVGLVYQLQS